MSISGFFANFKSFIPTVYKLGLVYTFIHRCCDVISSYEEFHDEINSLKQIFKLNGYSIQFIDRCIKQFLQKLYAIKAVQDTFNKITGTPSFTVSRHSVFFSWKQLYEFVHKSIYHTLPYFKNCFSIQNIIPKEIS